MRVSNWRPQEVIDSINTIVMENAQIAMEEVAEGARKKYDSYLHPYSGKHQGGDRFVTRHVKFTPKTGRNKGQLVEFDANTWLGRKPGQLRSTIRMVYKYGSGTVRVYAGNYKVFYARFVERGTKHAQAKPYLRPAFQEKKAGMLAKLKGEG
jgi:HK97 gp10 family phage protein